MEDVLCDVRQFQSKNSVRDISKLSVRYHANFDELELANNNFSTLALGQQSWIKQHHVTTIL